MKISKKVYLVGTIDEKDAKIQMNDRFGIVLTDKQLKYVIENHMSLTTALWYDLVGDDILVDEIIQTERGGGEVSIDTTTTENVADAICQQILKRNWPTSGEMYSLTKTTQRMLWRKIEDGLIKKGYRLTPNWLEEHLENIT